ELRSDLKALIDHPGRIKVPNVLLKDGLSLMKLSHKSKKRVFLKVDPSNFSISWKNVSSNQSIHSNSLHRLLISKTASQNNTIEIYFDDIKDLIFQENASPYREELHISKDFESNWCTVIYFNSKKGKLKTLNLIADTEYDFKRLTLGLKNLKLYRDDIRDKFLNLPDVDIPNNMDFLEENNKDTKEYLNFQDILKYTKRLNINIGQRHLQQIFDEVIEGLGSKTPQSNSATEGSPRNLMEQLDFEQFKTFVTILKKREDIEEIWKDLCGESNPMTYDVFKIFIRNTQKENFDDEFLSRLFKKFCIGKRDSWIPESLNNFLLSKYSPFLNSSFHTNLDQPLNEYFVSSSHNTYLMGRQVAGDSSIDGYVRALQRGCKCVEIDIWDGKDDAISDTDNGKNSFGSTNLNSDGPIVNHGRTFTSSISFVNVIKTIKKYAFISSLLPLILSLEIHCSIPNQLKLVALIKEILGDLLITVPLESDSYMLPSPNKLRNKILLKVKKNSGPFQSNENTEISTTSSTTTSFSEDNGIQVRRSSFSLRSKAEKPKIAPELSSLGIYVQGIKFRNFSLPESKTYNHCFSLSEKSINSMLKDDSKRKAIDKHNRKYLMRVYPSKFRLRSSNFIPINYWTHGVQFVATNWQTYDLGQQINEALFQGSQDQGYVLKPESLRKPTLKSIRAVETEERILKFRFDIEIISAHQLPKSKSSESAINPFVVFEIIGANSIEWDAPHMSKGRTHSISENGFNPVWNETFSGTIIARNELVFLKFTIKSSSATDEIPTIGILVTKFTYLNQGYRYLPICDLLGEQLIYSSLFVRIAH
ncbi:PLC-like phosphodiesterase, partial [Suhomyces tanzawaensis NRRL Y-17324]